MRFGLRRMIVVVGIGALSVAGAACESRTDNDPTPVKTFKITPAARTSVLASPPPPATATASAGPAAVGGVLALSASGAQLKFDTAALTANAGAVTIRFNNQDAGIVHNLHVFDGTDAKGTSAGQTELEVGPVEQELKLDLKPGAYYYQCDAHPTTMKGTLIVQ